MGEGYIRVVYERDGQASVFDRVPFCYTTREGLKPTSTALPKMTVLVCRVRKALFEAKVRERMDMMGTVVVLVIQVQRGHTVGQPL